MNTEGQQEGDVCSDGILLDLNFNGYIDTYDKMA